MSRLQRDIPASRRSSSSTIARASQLRCCRNLNASLLKPSCSQDTGRRVVAALHRMGPRAAAAGEKGANDADLRPTRPAPMPATAEYSMTGQRFSNRLCRRWCACSSCTCGRSGHTDAINGGAQPCWRAAQHASHRDRNAETAAFAHQLAGPRGSLRRWRNRR